MKSVLLAVLILFTWGCGGNGPVSLSAVKASAPNFIPPHPEATCPNGCIAGQSSPNYLELRFGPVNESEQNGFSTTLPFQMHVQSLDGWIGTMSNQVFESDSRLQITWPDGTWAEYVVQYDKHADLVGNLQRSFPVNLSLPAGTTLTVYHTGFGVITCPNSACGYDTSWRLYGN